MAVSHYKPPSHSRPLQWELRNVGPNRFHLRIGGYGNIGVLDGKVIASIHSEHAAEWEITRHVHRDAYT
jgi:hypothetical protein